MGEKRFPPRSGAVSMTGCFMKLRPVQVPSEEGTGETEATLADCGRFRKQLTCHQGWFPNLHEMPGMIQDSTLASCPEWDMSANGDTPRVSS